MSVKGDAQSEAPSSGALLDRVLAVCDRYAGLGFAAFIACHAAVEAFRAAHDGPLPHAGVEAEPALVALLALAVLLPFLLLAGRRLAATRKAPLADPRARSLALLERLTLIVTLVFLLGHLVQCALPIASGACDPSDVRPALIASLSGTMLGLPLVAAGYALGVGAASFFGTREVLRVIAPERRAARRVAVAFGVLAYALGCYAVVGCASGPILP